MRPIDIFNHHFYEEENGLLSVYFSCLYDILEEIHFCEYFMDTEEIDSYVDAIYSAFTNVSNTIDNVEYIRIINKDFKKCLVDLFELSIRTELYEASLNYKKIIEQFYA